ncbi:MAG: alpha-E domain-containing protein [Acidimicrobiales bacterium]|nr:alpha-E domain-containing protein [Acidimicrobiales bacterium]
MLSRIAEGLFWIGRYMERAEDTARILDVHIHHLLEAPVTSEGQLCQSLLAIMGVEIRDSAPKELTARRVTEILAFDADNPSSIVSSLLAARANARGVSEAISSEMWEALNATYNALPAHLELGRRNVPYAFFRFVRDRAAMVAGLSESSMSRDDAWRFFVLGRSLERVDMLTRLLSSAVVGSDPEHGRDRQPDWAMLLRSFSAHEAFLRSYRREPEPVTAVEFLLLDRLFPRSVFWALSTAEDCLAELDPRLGRAGMPDESRRTLGHLRTNLEFRRVDDLLEDLPSVLVAVQKGCAAASAALAARYFRYTNPIEWSSEVVGVES